MPSARVLVRLAWCVACVLLCVDVSRSQAQTIATSFLQLQVLVGRGDTITVRDPGGIDTTGKIDSLSPASLILLTETGPRELRESDVASIRQRRGDPLRNGAVIGLISGAGVAAALAALSGAMSDGDTLTVGDVAAFVGVYSGLGAAIGVGVDALIVSRQVIYEKPRTGSFTIAPLMAPGRCGATISLAF